MDNKQILSEIIVQISGFLIVFWILKKFAWSKLLGFIDDRRKKIGDEFAAIELKKKEIEAIQADYQNRLRNIEQEARTLIQEATQRGILLSKEIEEKAKGDAEKLLERAKEEIEQTMRKAKAQMRDEIIDFSALLTEKVIAKKMDPQEHNRLVNEFIKDLEKMK